MKKFLILFASFILGITACKKESNNNPKPISVIGSWHLFAVGNSLFQQAPADNIVLSFDASGKYSESTNDTVTAQGLYSITLENVDSVNQTFINYNPDLNNALAAQVNRSNDTLVLIPEVLSFDGYVLKYKKQ